MLKPMVDNNVIQVIVIALSFAIVLRALKSEQINAGKTAYQPIKDVIAILFEAIIRILN
jgi:Na+/H+-dicarboxylate symporter